jgi:peptidoglycan/LPS O-acetylase OafA/YrhL
LSSLVRKRRIAHGKPAFDKPFLLARAFSMAIQVEAAKAVATEPVAIGLPEAGRDRRTLSARLLAPGIFRLLLASAVVVNHYTRLQIGTAAVELFFILSGYWIDRMYDRQYSHLRAPAFVFIVSRIMRLMPMFLLFSVAAILLQNVLHTKVALTHIGFDVLPNFLILGYASLHERPLVPAWSLDIELQFYLIFPLLWGIIPRNRTTLGWATVFLLTAGGIYLGADLKDQSAIFLPYLGFFAIGIYASRAQWKPASPLIWLCAGVALTMLAITLALPQARGVFFASEGLPGRDWNTAGNIAFAIMLVPLAVSTVTRRSTRIDRTVGDLSYAVYCSHWIGVAAAAYYLSDAGWRVKLPFIAASIILTYAVSLIVLLWFDRPIGHLRERWIRRQPKHVDSKTP